MLVLNRRQRRALRKKGRRFENIVFNLNGAKAVQKTLRGRPHLAVPTVMLTEGVHNGSKGPGLYRQRETASTAQAWNGMPVVLDHPAQTAREPETLEESEFGVVLNTRWTNGKLSSWTYLDIERAKEIAPEVLEAIQNGKKVEVSTGLFVTRKKARGRFRGKRYNWIATNQTPDHLAVLPNEEGACSIKEGCGLLANKRCKKCQSGKVHNRFFSAGRRKKLAKKGTALPDGSFPIENIVDLHNAIRAFGRAKNKAAAKRHIIKRAKALGASNVLPSKWKTNNSSGMSPALTDPALTADELVLLSQPRKENDKMLSAKKKGRMVRQLIRNSGVWTEKDKKELLKMPDVVLKKIYSSAIEPDTDDGKSVLINKNGAKLKKKKKAQEPPKKKKKLVKNQDSNPKKKRVLSAGAWLKGAPPEVQSVFNQSMKALNNRRAKLVRTILKNKANKFSKKWLLKQDNIDLLEGMAVLARNTAKKERDADLDNDMFTEGFLPDYSGAVGASPVKNTGGKDEDAPEGFLTVPDMFGEKTKKSKKKAA